MSTLRELSVQYAKKQPKQVDQLLEDAPILDIIPFEQASHALWNAYEEITDVDGAGFVELDGALPTVAATSELKKVDLSIMGGKITVGEDKARAYGGQAKYFAKQMPAILRQTGMVAEAAIIYNNLLQYAIDNDNLEDMSGGAGDNCYSIVACRFLAGVTTGLYSPEGFKQGAMMNLEPINGGNLYDINSDGTLGYGMRIKNYFGLQLADQRTVAAMVNIDSDNQPTATDVDQLLDRVRAAGNTYLFMHRKVLSFLQDIKGSGVEYIEYNAAQKSVERRIASWNGIPIITSYNFSETEDVVSDT